jgi:nucleotide-binding universal stress UspA family protein
MTTTTTGLNKVSLPTMEKRIHLTNILLATDFSPAAKNALGYAGALAQSFGAKLYALHVQEPANYALPPEMWEASEKAQRSEMEDLHETLTRSFAGVRSEALLAEGGLWEAVALTIEKYGIEMVVLGTRGRGGLGKMILGSGAEEILRRANVPVLTVGPGVDPEKWPSGKFRSILLATEFGRASQAAMKYALSLAKENQASLTLLHVVDINRTESAASRAEVNETSEQKLRAMMPEDAKAWCTPHYLVQFGDPVEKILDTVERTEADLLVLGVHKVEGAGLVTSHHLPTATVHKLVARAASPVLTMRG